MFPESDNFLEMNNNAWDIAVSGVDTVHGVTSE
jgi:hypothetical protein